MTKEQIDIETGTCSYDFQSICIPPTPPLSHL